MDGTIMVTTAPSARVLLFNFKLHVERLPLAQKLGKLSEICFQLILLFVLWYEAVLM